MGSPQIASDRRVLAVESAPVYWSCLPAEGELHAHTSIDDLRSRATLESGHANMSCCYALLRVSSYKARHKVIPDLGMQVDDLGDDEIASEVLQLRYMYGIVLC